MTDASTKRPRWHYGMPVVVNFTSVFLSFVARMLVARLIGPASFGLFAIWLNNIQLFGTAGTFGQQNFVLRELALAPGPKSEEARTTAFAAVKVSLLVGAISGVAGAIFLHWFQGGSPQASVLQGVAALMSAVLLTLSAVHRGLGSLTVGLLFDRIMYQLLFILLMIPVWAIAAGGVLEIQIYTATLIAAAAASFAYLLVELGTKASSVLLNHRVMGQARRVVPFFIVNSLWVLNSRYLLSYCGIFLHGAVLGQIGLVFTVISIMVIPTSTLNLVAAPILARRLAKPGATPMVLLYLFTVSVLVLSGVAAVFIAHNFIFRLAKMELTISAGTILLLCCAFGIILIGNAGLIVEQLRGRAVEVARLFSLIMATKLTAGYWVGDHYGVTALFWLDIGLGLLFVAVLMKQLLKSPEIRGESLRPASTAG